MTAVHGRVNLTAAQIGDLVTDKTDLRVGCRARYSLRAGSCAMCMGVVRTDPRMAARWLDSRPKDEGFIAQPWHELAAVYNRNS